MNQATKQGQSITNFPVSLVAGAFGFAVVSVSLVSASPDGIGSISDRGIAERPRPVLSTVVFDRPTKDTSTYSNIGASGNTRPYAWMSTFPGEGRQSNLVTMFDTASAGVPTGIEAARVKITRMVFTACTYPAGPRATYDASPDAWQNSLWSGGDIIIYDSWGGTTPVGTEFVPAEPRYVS
ncbi:MAG: hypothetical protein K8E66_12715, partial [Phycisphaerales bacterium]|nr:hypothetical protein [Phycisphaerales bacterium]